MGPKVAAACAFVQATGQRAVIGSLDRIEALCAGLAGTEINADGMASSQQPTV
jgi:carbamate kinase